MNSRRLRVNVIGLGYVGLPLRLLFSEQKFRVTGFDADQHKVDTLTSGGSYIYRILSDEIAAATSSGFAGTSGYAHISENGRGHHLRAIPLNDYHEPDLSYFEKAAHAIGRIFARSAHCARKQNLSRNCRRSPCSHSGKREQAWTEGRAGGIFPERCALGVGGSNPVLFCMGHWSLWSTSP